jgi:hypothetical protein
MGSIGSTIESGGTERGRGLARSGKPVILPSVSAELVGPGKLGMLSSDDPLLIEGLSHRPESCCCCRELHRLSCACAALAQALKKINPVIVVNPKRTAFL